MEIKATLEAPYTEEQKVEFIIEQNHNLGYEIRGEQPETLTAWGYTEEEKQQQERARLDAMTLTPADVWRALYKAKGLTQAQLLTLIETQMTGIDIEAIKIEFGASLFYRGAKFGNNKMFDVIGNLLGYTADDMDYLFEHKELPEEEEQETIDYSQYTVAQLKTMADERGLTYASNILKADLIALLEQNDSEL